jgi:hypothetical protein
MKNILILCLVGVCISGYSFKPRSDNNQHSKSKLLILELKADTSIFEGGIEMELTQPKKPVKTIPLNIIYNKPMDFGDITFFYELTGQTVFNATIVWNGKGQITAPLFQPASHFKKGKNRISMPEKIDSLPYCQSFSGLGTKNLEAIWTQIADLTIVKEYINQKADIAIYHYTPSVGTFDAAGAKWIVFLYVE